MINSVVLEPEFSDVHLQTFHFFLTLYVSLTHHAQYHSNILLLLEIAWLTWYVMNMPAAVC